MRLFDGADVVGTTVAADLLLQPFAGHLMHGIECGDFDQEVGFQGRKGAIDQFEVAERREKRASFTGSAGLAWRLVPAAARLKAKRRKEAHQIVKLSRRVHGANKGDALNHASKVLIL